jgi:hypothetical protein
MQLRRVPSFLYCVFCVWICSGGIRPCPRFPHASSTVLVSAYDNFRLANPENVGVAKVIDHDKNLRGVRGSRSSNHNNIKMIDTRQMDSNDSRQAQGRTIRPLHGPPSNTSTRVQRKLTNIHELVDRPIDQWELQDWIFLLVVLFIISIIFRIFSRISCCGCSLMDCLTCWFCWELFCDPTPGMDYGFC